MYIDLLAYIAGSITAICFLPQIVQTLRARSAREVSLSMLLLTILSAIVYELYAVALSLWPVVIMNGVLVVMVTTEVGLKIYFEKYASEDKTTASLDE